jgi:hypothetical protein
MLSQPNKVKVTSVIFIPASSHSVGYGIPFAPKPSLRALAQAADADRPKGTPREIALLGGIEQSDFAQVGVELGGCPPYERAR